MHEPNSKFSPRLKIGCDIDDVLVHFQKSLFAYYNRVNGTSFNVQNVTEYNPASCLGLDPEQMRKVFDEFHASPDLACLPPVDGAHQALGIISRFADIYALTARHKSLDQVTRECLKKNFTSPDIPFEEIHFCYNHQTGEGGEHKAEIAARLGIDCMIEDSLPNAYEMVDRGIPTLLIPQKWNFSPKPHNLLIRCSNGWEDIPGILASIWYRRHGLRAIA